MPGTVLHLALILITQNLTVGFARTFCTKKGSVESRCDHWAASYLFLVYSSEFIWLRLTLTPLPPRDQNQCLQLVETHLLGLSFSFPKFCFSNREFWDVLRKHFTDESVGHISTLYFLVTGISSLSFFFLPSLHSLLPFFYSLAID